MSVRVIVKAVETCTCAPVQWDLWDAEGRYYYLRYRHGRLTVEEFPSPDVKTWNTAGWSIFWQWSDDPCMELEDLKKPLRMWSLEFSPECEYQYQPDIYEEEWECSPTVCYGQLSWRALAFGLSYFMRYAQNRNRKRTRNPARKGE